MNCERRVELRLVFATLLLASVSSSLLADPYINEIFFDPPGSSGDNTQEFFELRGTPGASLSNHYLVLLENENNSADTGSPGQIDFIVDLSGRSFSPTGFFTLRQRNSPYTSVPNDAFNPINTLGTGSVNGWGTTPGVDNNLGIRNSNLYSTEPGKIENSGFTAMLIRVNAGGTAPTLGQNLDGDVDNDNNPSTIHDGLDFPNGVPDISENNPAWSILDSVGIYSEASAPGQPAGEAIYGRTYAAINFGPEIPGQSYTFLDNGSPTTVTFQPNLSPGQTYVGLGFEVEHIARWGNSTGQTAADWHITNDTDNANSGYSGAANGFRQSGRYHDSPIGADDFVETNQFVPYGANLTNTLGAANYPLNLSHLPWDYNNNNVVDAADYVIWRKTFGSTTNLGADGNGGKKIEEDDFTFWRARYGYTLGGPGAGSSLGSDGVAVPEPAAWLLSLIAATFATLRRLPRRRI